MLTKNEARELLKNIIAQHRGAIPVEMTVLHLQLAVAHCMRSRIQKEIDQLEVAQR